MNAFEWSERHELHQPVLVVMLLGWIDAGSAAATAMGVLDSSIAASTVGTFDSDIFIDYRARRPIMELRDGVNTNLVWPQIRLKHGQDPSGRDVLLLTGHEPDAMWHRFGDLVGDIAVELGASFMLGFGAYPFATPHTRPSRISVTCGSPEVAATMPFNKNSVDVPAGVEAVLERALTDRGVPASGLWVQVPHYVANAPYPAASIALLDALRQVTGISADTALLQEEAQTHRMRLDELVAASQEHLLMVQQLETVFDQEAPTQQLPISGPLPTGDELAAELERYLREQGK